MTTISIDTAWEREFRKHQSKYDIKPKHKEKIRPKKFRKIEVGNIASSHPQIIVNKAEGIFKNHKILNMEANFKETTNPKVLRKTFDSVAGKYTDLLEKVYFNEPNGRTNYDKAQFTIKFESLDEKKDHKATYKTTLEFKDILEDYFYSETASIAIKFQKGQESTQYTVYMSLQAFGFSKE